MQMIRWMCGVSMKGRRKTEELIKLVGVQPITTVIRGSSVYHIMYVQTINIYIHIYLCYFAFM